MEPENSRTVNTQRLEITSLTWLRGVAALLVVVAHTVRATEVSYGNGGQIAQFLPLNVLDLGALGVALFFVLSGCTLYISNSHLNAHRWRDVFAFYIKRVMRIWPAFVISLLVYFVFREFFQVYYGVPLGNWIEYQFLEPADMGNFLSYLLLVFNINGPVGLYNNAYWSLPVEFQYYLLFPLLVVAVRWNYLGPVLVAGMMFFLARSGMAPFANDIVFTLAFTFAAGLMIGRLYVQQTLRINGAVAVILSLCIIALASLLDNDVIGIELFRVIPSEWVFYGLCAIALVALVLFGNCRLPRWLEPLFMYLGHISYSFYLYHNLMIASAILLLINFEIVSGWVPLLVVVLFAFVGTWGIAVFSYRWVEEPGTRLGRKLAKRVR